MCVGCVCRVLTLQCATALIQSYPFQYLITCHYHVSHGIFVIVPSSVSFNFNC